MKAYPLIDYMGDVADKATTPWARRFATSMCRQSLRPGWKPSPKQSRMMLLMIKQLPDDCDGFEVIDYDDDFTQEVQHHTQGQLALA